MGIVTGDRYLEHLVRFVDRSAGPLLDGALTLKLNPVGLHYVQSRLEALRELEGLLAGAPVDYLRAYVSDLGDHRALEQLRRILRLLTSLKVITVLPPPARDPTPLSLLPFARLRVLELRGCDLSTSAARGLLDLRHTLEKLICHNSTDALRHIFASRIVDINESPVWNRLSFVSCACNGLVLMDESLQLLPVVETLDLSRNCFAKVDNLRKCTKLKHLDLGFNHLRTIASLREVSCPIVKLVLRNNAITSLRGLENLKSVEGLDLSYNIISSFSELEILASLSCLQSLWLEGNPISCARWYRAHVFSFLSHPERLKLDEKGISTREYWERHIIFANRQKQPAGYGFYFPAKFVEDEESIITKRKKHSRLANIEDDEHRRYFCSDVVDQESVSCDSNSFRKDETAISDGESEIVGLMTRVEYMKKERSVLWLREFKEWLDQTSEDTMHGGHVIGFNLDPVKEKYLKQRKGRKHIGESSKYVPDIIQVSDGGSSSNILESDMSFPDTYIGVHGNEYFNNNGRGILEPPVLNGGDVSITDFGTKGVSSDQDHLEVDSRVPHNLSPLEANGHSNRSSSLVEGNDQKGEKISSTPLTVFDEIMGSRPSSICPGSPPHYQQDILHRRLYLEEEFLQLSAESLSAVSSDSDTSCSEDDSCIFHASVPELESFLIQGSTEQGTSGHSDVLLDEDNHCVGHGETCLKEIIRDSSHYCMGPDSGVKKYLLPNHGKPSAVCNIVDDLDGCEIDQVKSEDVGGMVKQKGKHKPKRRIASLMESSVVCNTGVEFPNSNGSLDIGKDDIDAKGKPSCNENYIHDSCDQAAIDLSHNHEVKNSTTNDARSCLLKTKHSSLNPELDDAIKDFFHVKMADSRGSETCQQIVRCGCIFQVGSGIQESEVALLLSCENNLYMLLIEAEPDGQGIIFKILGCHRPEDVREVVIGLGLQALRVRMEEDSTYLFLPRTVGKSKDLLCLMQICDSSPLSCGCSLQSWEQVQVKLLEKCIRRSLKMGIFLYSMFLFWHDKCEGKSWLSRSLFVIDGYVLVCMEDFIQFGSSTNDFGSSPPYYSLVSCCPIQNILEMVIELNDRCVTLSLDNATWKLKWYSEDTLLKFVPLLKAIHSGLTSSPLPVKCVS